MEPYSRHVFICAGGYCSPGHEGRELYALLRRHSILGGDAQPADDAAAFARGVAMARDSGAAGALGRLFSARALMLDGALAPASVPDYLHLRLQGTYNSADQGAGIAFDPGANGYSTDGPDQVAFVASASGKIVPQHAALHGRRNRRGNIAEASAPARASPPIPGAAFYPAAGLPMVNAWICGGLAGLTTTRRTGPPPSPR